MKPYDASGGRAARYLATFALGIGLLASSSCVIVPYLPPSERSWEPAELDSLAEARLTIGPRERIEECTAIAEDSGCEVVDSLTFRDAVFPDGSWTLGSLLDPTKVARARELGVDHVVLLRPLVNKTWHHRGFFFWCIGFFGLATTRERRDSEAILLELESGRAQVVRVKVNGRGFYAGWVYGLLVVPLMESSVERGLRKALAKELEAHAGSGGNKVAILALEPELTRADVASRLARSELGMSGSALMERATFINF